MSDPQTEREPNVSSTAPASLESAQGALFRANLEQFGDRAARLCQMLRAGRISSESCFRALTQLWLQVARSRSTCGGAEQIGRHAAGDDKQESGIL